MRLKRVYLDEYRVGDVLAFDPVEPIALEKQRAWAKARPRGRAWSARRRDDGAVIACMGLVPEEGGDRAWALAARGLGPATWGDLLRLVRTIIEGAPARVIRATAASAEQAACLERCGFLPTQMGGALVPFVRLK